MSRDAVSPNDFNTGSDIQRIRQAVAEAAAAGAAVVIPRINQHGPNKALWLIDEAILLPSHITVLLENCHIKLSDRCRDNFFRSANCGMGITDIPPLENIHLRGSGRVLLEGADRPRATGDGAKTLGTQTYGTDANVEGEHQKGDWRNIGILLAGVTDFSIENIRIKDAHCWAISLEYCSHGRVRDIDFEAHGHRTIDGEKARILNQDGLDLRRGCHDILIENITGRTGDDLIALTALPGRTAPAGSPPTTMVSGPEPRLGIWNVVIRNVRGHSSPYGIIRLLNNGGLRMHDIVIDGLIDTSTPPHRSSSAIKIGENNPHYGGETELGETTRILINNVISRATHTVRIVTSLSDSVISNVIRYDQPGEPITYDTPRENIRNVRVVNVS